MGENFVLKVIDEYEKAALTHGDFNSPHEGYAVIKEELDKLWDEIKRKDPSKKAMKREAIQVAAMALRFLYDCCRDSG